MRHGKRPTRAQKIMLQKRRLNPNNWLIIRDDVRMLILKNRVSGNVRILRREYQK